MKLKNVQSALDPHAKYIFLDDRGMTEAFAIRGVEGNAAVVTGEVASGDQRSGYFVAAAGKGIIRFDAQVSGIKGKKKLARLKIASASLKLVDRREFHRFEFSYPLPVYLRCEGKFIKARLINISEGGLRMTINRKLPTQIVFGFELKLPRPEAPLNFITDGLIVYCEPEENPAQFMTGVSFIAPDFQSERAKQEYLNSRKELAHYIGVGAASEPALTR